jgi:hypothetical protein
MASWPWCDHHDQASDWGTPVTASPARPGQPCTLPGEAVRAVVINVHTDIAATLAIASIVATAQLPALLVNCEPTAESRRHFEALQGWRPFAVIEAPTRPHGATLDWLFRETRDDALLLLDSDAEILDASVVAGLIEPLEENDVFGVGYRDGGGFIDKMLGTPGRTVWMAKRPWSPFVLLRAAPVQQALAAGASFLPSVVLNDFRFNQRVNRLLASRLQTELVQPSRFVQSLPPLVRHRLRRSRLPWLAWARRRYGDVRPSIVYADTGTGIYQWCCAAGLRFRWRQIAQPVPGVHHYGGLTRVALDDSQWTPEREESDPEEAMRERLATAYGIALR